MVGWRRKKGQKSRNKEPEKGPNRKRLNKRDGMEGAGIKRLNKKGQIKKSRKKKLSILLYEGFFFLFI